MPTLPQGDLRQVGGEAPVPSTAIALIGRAQPEQAVLRQLDAQYGHASGERAISGPGLIDVYRALQANQAPQQPGRERTAAQIVQDALEHSDAACQEAPGLFCAFLGTAAGKLALTLGARGGVYIGGGIVPRLGSAFDQSPFRARYEYALRSREGHLLAQKADPYALQSELRPDTASVVARMPAAIPASPQRQRANALDAAMSIYEVHLASWRRKDGNQWLNWDELADQLVRCTRARASTKTGTR